MRFLLLSAVLFLTSMMPASAQDAFAGADDGNDSFSSSGAPRLQGATNGTIGPMHSGTETVISGVNTAGSIPVTRAMTAEEFKKAARALAKLDDALEKTDLRTIALQCYKIYNETGNHAYQSLGDIASDDIDLDDVETWELIPHKDTLRRIFELQGRTEGYISQALMRFNNTDTVDGEAEVAIAKTSQKEAGLPGGGLRKLNGNEVRVFIPGAEGSHEVMVRHCIKRAVEQICAATNNGLQLKFVAKEDNANLKINYDQRSYLWYNLQNHTMPTLSDPYEGPSIKSVLVHVPLYATMHRKVSEAECQEFCLREITRALGYAWAPVSMERFTHDFAAEVAKAKKQQGHSVHIYNSGITAAGSPGTAQNCVENALYGPNDPGRPQYYAGLAYFSRGDYDMARRYFCNATEFFNENAPALHSVVNRYIGMGDGSSAELIVFACINDDPNNDEASPATREYERIKHFKRGETGRALPTLAQSDAQMLAKIYSPQTAKRF